MKQARGKFLGTGPGGGDSSLPSASAASAIVRPKRTRSSAIERQAKLFDDLDEAESLTLELLSLASSTALSLSDAIIIGATPEKMEDFFLKSKLDGQAYMEKVKRIHALLSPRAPLVVSYKNHDVDTGGVTRTPQVPLEALSSPRSPSAEGVERMEKIVSEEGVKRKREGSNQDYSEALVSSSSLDHAHASDVNKDVNLPKNMYAARVELRLAVERREVLREMMRLEKERVKVAKKIP